MEQSRERNDTEMSPEDPALASSLLEHLQSFAAQLDDQERAVLSAMVRLGDRNPHLLALAAEPGEALLRPEERAIVERLQARPAPTGTGLRSPLAVIMKGTKICNLRCTYCRSWSDQPDQVMPFEVLAHALYGVLLTPGVQHVEFIWHGGETTLRPLSFYRKALWLQQLFRRPGQRITNSIQTNGTTLNDSWLDFLQRYDFSVGVSLDGPPEIHDRRRLDIQGRPTSGRVRQGLAQLRAHGLKHGVLMVVDDDVIALGAARLLEFFLETGVGQVSLLNVGPEGEPGRNVPGDYLRFPRFVEFLRELFLLWWPAHVNQISFREITDLVKRVRGEGGNFCVFEENCMGGVLTVEPRGELSICDKYQGDAAYQLGRVTEMDVADLPAGAPLTRARVQTDTDMAACRACRWYSICQGGCPHDRYVRVQRGLSEDEGCCGWAPLIDTMARTMAASSSRNQSFQE